MRYIFYLTLLVFLLNGCTNAVVTSVYDPNADISSFKSYGWLATAGGPGDNVRVDNPQVDSLVKAAVNKAMAKKGYSLVSDKESRPDIFVTWLGAIESKVKQESINKFYSTYGYGAVAAMNPEASGPGGGKVEYEEGTILLDFLNAGSKEMIWRGSSTDKLRKGMNDKEAELYIERLVVQMLKNFPDSKR